MSLSSSCALMIMKLTSLFDLQGPCGEEWDPAYDGTVEQSPPFGNPRSDGISLACMDSLVEKNVSPGGRLNRCLVWDEAGERAERRRREDESSSPSFFPFNRPRPSSTQRTERSSSSEAGEV